MAKIIKCFFHIISEVESFKKKETYFSGSSRRRNQGRAPPRKAKKRKIRKKGKKEKEENKEVKEFTDFMKCFEKRLVKEGIENGMEWFKRRNLSKEVIEQAMLTKIIKPCIDKETGEERKTPNSKK